MNDDQCIQPLLTLQDIMKSDTELEYIKEMQNFTFKIIENTDLIYKRFLHQFVLQKRNLKLFRFCISHAISDHVDMVEEDNIEGSETFEETLEEKLKSLSTRTHSLYLDNDEIIMKQRSTGNSPNELNESLDSNLLTENAVDQLVDTTTVIGNVNQNNSTECDQNQGSSDTFSSSSATEIPELHMQSSSLVNNEIYWNMTGYDLISEPRRTLNATDSVHEFPRNAQIFPSIGQLFIHFFDSIWFPHTWHEWQINEILSDNYVEVAVEVGSIASTSESIWRRLFSNSYAYFSVNFENSKILKLKRNHSRINRVCILSEIMRRERGGYLNELKVLDAIAWPYYYTLPPQNEEECSMFEFDMDWYSDRDPFEYTVVAFETFFKDWGCDI